MQKKLQELGVSPYALQTSNPFTCLILIYGRLCLNQYHQLLPGIPFQNGVAFVCVSYVTFIFSYCKLMNNPHSPITNVHVITVASFSLVRTPLGLIFLDLVFPFKWSEIDVPSLECSVPYWPSIRNMSHFQQHPLLIPRLYQSTCLFWLLKAFDLNCVHFLLCGLGVGGQFSLFVVGGRLSLLVVCKSSMLLHHL